MRTLSFLFLMVLSGLIISGCAGTQISDTTTKSRTNKPFPPDTAKQVKQKSSASRWQIVLSWSAPTTNSNGTPLTDLAGYKIYYKTSRKSKYRKLVDIKDPKVTSYKLVNPKRRTYYFVITAYNNFRLESKHSNMVRKSSTNTPVQSK